jgi:hypothetical protein
MRTLPCILCLFTALAAAEGQGPGGFGPPGQGPGGPSGQRPSHPPLSEMLKQADADGDGKVTLAEFVAAFERRRTEEKTKAFAQVDANGDGQITRDEFLAHEPTGPDGQRAPRPDPAELFKRLDRDGDGAIPVTEGERRDPFAEADANGDGQLSKEEIAAFREKMKAEGGSRRDDKREEKREERREEKRK